MPIKGLTTQVCDRKFPIIGYLYKGAEKVDKKLPGKSLEYFRFKPVDKTDKDLIETFTSLFGNTPKEITFIFPYPELGKNWETYREEIREDLGLRHRCDGEYCILIFDDKKGKFIVPQNNAVLCPGNCIPVGKLNLFIPELKRIGVIQFLTHSKLDIIAIENLMNLIKNFNYTGIPFKLQRYSIRRSFVFKDKTTDKFVKKIREDWAVKLEIHPSYIKQFISSNYQLPKTTEQALGQGVEGRHIGLPQSVK